MSDIVYSSIDTTFPVAGKDNDSQGFRDNFTIIQTALNVAKTEISELENTSARTNTDNNFHGNQISNVQLINYGETYFNGEAIGGNNVTNVTVDYANGCMQEFQVTNNITLTLANFPSAGTAAKLRIHLLGDSVSSHTVTFVGANGGVLKKSNAPLTVNNPVTVPQVQPSSNPTLVFDFWTFDGGSNIFMNYLGSYSA